MRSYDVQFIGGRLVGSTARERIPVMDPSTEEVIGAVPSGTAADADAAVAAAVTAFGAWERSSVDERVAVLRDLRDGLADRREELADLISAEMGMPRTWSRRIQIGNPLAVLEDLIEVLKTFPFAERHRNSLVTREPVGVTAAIAPWNLPVHQVMAKVAPAIAAGCAVVVKPSEVTPLSSYVLAEIVAASPLPPGVVNIVNGTGPIVGERLAAHADVDMLSFTGSLRAGRRVAELAARSVKRVTLELGGKSPNILLDDADLGAVVPAAVQFDAFLNAGQVCSAFTRLLVPRSLQEDVALLAADTAARLTVGPSDADVDMGPLVSAAQRDRVVGYIRRGIEEGARLVAGGPEPPDGLEQGYFVRPTVFADVTPAMTIAQEEIFGPVLAIMPYDSVDEAVEIANASIYGLAGSVYSADLERSLEVARRLRAGQVNVNGGAFNVCAPFGGFKQSGYGREFGKWGLEEYLEIKSYQLPEEAPWSALTAAAGN